MGITILLSIQKKCSKKNDKTNITIYLENQIEVAKNSQNQNEKVSSRNTIETEARFQRGKLRKAKKTQKHQGVVKNKQNQSSQRSDKNQSNSDKEMLSYKSVQLQPSLSKSDVSHVGKSKFYKNKSKIKKKAIDDSFTIQTNNQQLDSTINIFDSSINTLNLTPEDISDFDETLAHNIERSKKSEEIHSEELKQFQQNIKQIQKNQNIAISKHYQQQELKILSELKSKLKQYQTQ
ncbi:UNKNOWN [Stylonychia lemnae]|uniref:Uncharacterized protein n=1 Tax=Stylonychia lemnae TaxID=5949 RepID=A0A078AEV0_STYLE|nr:UNKNOWN [Stylonychia lemnae]|eukprot:CDW80755.1 UNKNOWN [Stylonychia lemnae]